MPIIGKDDFDEDDFFDLPTPPLMTINMKSSRPEGDPLVPVARSLMEVVGVLARTDYSLAEFIMNSLKNEGIPTGMLKYVSNDQLVRAITNEVERVEEVKVGGKFYPPPSYSLMGVWYDLISEVPRALGAALVYWSERSTGSPANVEYEEWTATLKKHGEALIEFARADAGVGTLTQEKNSDAQEALHWFADNLQLMWD